MINYISQLYDKNCITTDCKQIIHIKELNKTIIIYLADDIDFVLRDNASCFLIYYDKMNVNVSISFLKVCIYQYA